MKYYFAYGSNMNSLRIKNRKFVYSKRLKAKLFNYKLIFNAINFKLKGAAFANIMPSANSIVEGIVYLTNEKSLKELDKFEISGKCDYHRKELEVETDEGKLLCVVYVTDKIAINLKPTKEYLSHLLKGKEFLSKGYYEKLKKIETID